ncbi:hypothetical protein FDZ71_01740 [bacterium]|nr:MAG: hypothetical protein FDZ71_01740 [bacterium]
MAESAGAKQGEEVGHILILTRNGVVGELIRAHLSAEGFCTTIVPAPFALADGQKYRRAIALCDCDSLYAVNFREYAEKIITWADSQGFRPFFSPSTGTAIP